MIINRKGHEGEGTSDMMNNKAADLIQKPEPEVRKKENDLLNVFCL